MKNRLQENIIIIFLSIVFGCTIITTSFFINKLYDDKIYKPKIELSVIKGLSNNSGSLVVKDSITVESGDLLPEISDYFISKKIDLAHSSIHYFSNNVELTASDISYTDNGYTYTCGVYDLSVIIKTNKGTFNTLLIIQDTTLPSFVLKDVVYSDNFNLDDFIEVYKDNSLSDIHTITMEQDISELIKLNGNYRVDLVVCDISGNCDRGSAYLTVNQPDNDTKNNKENNSGKKNNNKNNKNNKNNNNNGSGGNSGSGGNTGSNPGTGSDPVIDDHGSGNTEQGPLDPGGSVGIDPGSIGEYHEVTCELPRIDNIGNQPVINTVVNYELVCTFSKYGAVIKGYANVTYSYTSEYVKVITNIGNVDYSIVVNSFSATLIDMLPEAQYLYDGLTNSRNTIIEQTNILRSQEGVTLLQEDRSLDLLATVRAIEIAYSSKFSHTRPNGSKWFTVLQEYGYKQGVVNGWTNCGENLAYGYADDVAVVQIGWKNSPGHYQNMVRSEFRKIGVGKYHLNGRTYTVQLFST